MRPGPARARHRAEQHRTALAGVEAVSLRSDRGFPRHAHDTYGIGILLEGGHRSWSGRGPVEAGPGECIAVNPGEMHDGHPVGRAARSWRMLHLDPALLADLDPGRSGTVEIVRPAFRDPALATGLLAAHALLADPATDPMAGETALLRVLRRLLDRHGDRRIRSAKAAPCIRRAVDLIEAAPERPLTLADLAAAAGIGRFQLLRAFARDVGTTPHAYLLQRRVRLARAALARGETPAASALLAGFADQSHLTRAFGRQFGTTPARYRAAVAPRPQ